MSKKEEEVLRISGDQLFNQKRDILKCTMSADIGLGGGIPRGSTVLIGGRPKLGKALSNDSLILYRDGWKEIGKCKVGDEICGSDGNFHKVLGVFPQGKKQLFKVTFNDGASVLTCKDHLWKINYRISKKENSKYRSIIRTTEHIRNDIKFYGLSLKYKNKIDFVKPVVFDKKQLPVDPYILGQYLVSISYADNDNKYDSHILSILDKTWKTNWTDNWNNRDINKDFVFSSINDRIRLIEGMMNENKVIVSTSEKMTKTILFIINSLGGYCSINNDKDIGIQKITATFTDQFVRQALQFNQSSKPFYRTIVSITEAGEGDATCIQIDSQDSLFVTNDFILTHNTTISLQYAAYGQKHFNAKVFYFNIEGRLSRLVLSQIQGLSLDADKFEVISASPIYKNDKIIGTKKLSGEKWWDEIGNCILNNPGAIIIVDSIANMSNEKEFSEEMGHQDRGTKNKLESQFCRKYGDLIAPAEITLFLLTHIQANTSGYGSPFQAKVGNDIRHQADIILFGSKVKKWDPYNDKILGHDMIYNVEASALGPPNIEIEVPLRYGYGCDNITDLINFCINYDIIKKSGSWFSLPFNIDGDLTDDEKQQERIQGQANIWNLLVGSQKKYDCLYELISKKLLL